MKKVSDSITEMTELVLPNDTNVLGNLMGGNLMRWMDIASAICASRHCGAHVVTVSVDHMTFHEPIKLGDIVTIRAKVSRTFNSSMEIFMEVFTRSILVAEPRKSNQAYFTLWHWMTERSGLSLFRPLCLKLRKKKNYLMKQKFVVNFD